MPYSVKLSPHARRDLKSLPREAQTRIAAAIDALAETPRPSNVKKLAGSGNTYRIRTGDYRLVYEIEDDVLLVLVLRIGHRRGVYRGG